MPKKNITIAVFPVAGLGTRFLPAAKAIPKEMLTIVDRPVIQMAVDEAREAGIQHFVFVTGRGKGAIEDHFDKAHELEEALKARGRSKELAGLAGDLPAAGRTSFTRQQEPLGLGHAVWCARDIVGNQPFALLLPDMLMKSKPGCLSQVVQAYNERGGNIIAVEEVSPDQVHRYGVVDVGEADGRCYEVRGMVEKPSADEAPSNLIISGRYILQPEIFALIENQGRGAGGEIQLTDAMLKLMAKQAFSAVKFTGTTYDCSDKVGFLAANVAFGLDRRDLAGAFKEQLKRIIAEAGGLD